MDCKDEVAYRLRFSLIFTRDRVNQYTSRPAYKKIARKLAKDNRFDDGQLRLFVVSDSMAPLLRAGDSVTAEPFSVEKLKRGDIVVVWQKGEFITHRFMVVDDDGWRTKGDRLHRLDPPVQADAIVGRVFEIDRQDGRINLLDRRWSVVNRLKGWLGYWEARLFQAARRVRDRLRKN